MKASKRTKNNTKEPWQIAAARFCVNNSEKGFTISQLKEHVQSKYKVDDTHIQHFYEEEIFLPTGRKFTRNSNSDDRWIPPLDLVSKVTDYDELKEARKNATIASWLSLMAIIISATSLLLNIQQVEIANLQAIPEKINQAQAKSNAIHFCEENPDAVQNYLYDTRTGEPADCKQVLEEL